MIDAFKKLPLHRRKKYKEEVPGAKKRHRRKLGSRSSGAC